MDEQSWMRIKEDLEQVKSRFERAKQREHAMKEARSKQLRLLPEVPELAGFEFARLYKPCDAVGGDFYAFFRTSDDAQAIAIGDISGHGIEAALLMGLAKKLLEVHGRGRASPAQTLALANRDIFTDLDERTFVTVFYALLDPRTRSLRFSRAGHEPLLLYNPERTPTLSILDSKGMALGMDEGPSFEQTIEEVEVTLRPGDLVLQYTDGITEAMNARNEPFGHDRLYAVLEEHGRHEAEYVLWRIEKAVEAFRGREPRRDDMTMIALKVLA
jgi:sigma-B regulation protein RsbU (phosphoserine phosphatase)